MRAKRVLALFLSAAMVIPVSACNKSTQNNSNPVSSSPNSEVDASPVALSILVQGDPTGVTENNPIIEKIEANTNTKLSITIVDDVTKTVNMEIASGSLQDIVVTQKFSFYDYIDSGNFVELTDLLKQYGSEVTNNHISQQAWDVTKVEGGKIYGIPGENYNSKYVTAFRTDWLSNLNIGIKDDYTLDELTNILKAFTNNDPDGDGKKDTYGLTTAQKGSAWNQSLMAIFGAFGGQPNQTYLENNKFVPFNTSDDFRAALQYIKGLWDDGVIDPEIFILTADEAIQKLAQGKAGAFSSWWSGPKDIFKAGLLDITPDADFTKVFITSNDGSKVGMMDNGLLNYMTMISTNCKNPAAAMKFINYLWTDEGDFLLIWGVEGLTYSVDADGYYTKITTDKDYTPLSTVVRRMDTNIKQKYDLTEKKDITSHNFEWIQHTTGVPLYQSIFYGVPTTTDDQELGTELDTYVSQSVVDFITGAKELNDANWQAYKQGWVQKGGQKILDSYAAKYNTLKGTSYASEQVA